MSGRRAPDAVRRLVPAALCAAAFAAGAAAAAQEPGDRPEGRWGRYQPGTLAQVLAGQLRELEGFLTPDAPPYALSGRDVPTVVRVSYTGTTRPLSPGNARMIDLWVRAFDVGSGTQDLFASELLFVEDGVEFWLPVQSALLAHFRDELRPGDPVLLYVIWIGARRENGELVGTFLVNEFDRAPER